MNRSAILLLADSHVLKSSVVQMCFSTHPFSRALSSLRSMSAWPSRTTSRLRSGDDSFVRIHLIPYTWGESARVLCANAVRWSSYNFVRVLSVMRIRRLVGHQATGYPIASVGTPVFYITTSRNYCCRTARRPCAEYLMLDGLNIDVRRVNRIGLYDILI